MIAGSLTAIGVVWGLLAWWVFRRFTDRAELRKTGKRLYAHLLEIRLYSEDPALVFAAQRALILDNARFLRLVAGPVIILAIPFALLYPRLDSIYGRQPVAVGHAAIVTLRPPDGLGDSAELRVPAGVAVETPPIRDFADRWITWRIRAVTAVRGRLVFTLEDGKQVSCDIVTGDAGLHATPRRTPLTGAGWIEVDYPAAHVAIAGMSLPWLAWFFPVSAITAALLALRPGKRPDARYPLPEVSGTSR